MLKLVLFPALMQLSAVPDEFFEQTYSEEATAVVAGQAERDGEAITRALEALGKAGDASAFEALGEIYANGLFGVTADERRACDYYEMVGDRRADALHNQATCYYGGTGRALDLAKARELYVQAAKAGWRMSYCAYGNMLVRGEGGPVDAAEGIRLCRMTAILGDADAQTDYGTYLLTGNGVERDPVAARFMLEQAGAQKQRNAAFLLGQIHIKGDGTPKDLNVAGDWFAKAYDWGRPDAAFEVAKTYFQRGFDQKDEGNVVLRPELLDKALEWAKLAKRVEVKRSPQHAEAARLEKLVKELLVVANKGAD